MNPNQCGTGRHLTALHPDDRREVERFADWLATGGAHVVQVRHLMETGAPLQLIAAPPYRVDDLVKVVDETDPNFGRWGIVVDVHDYREGDVPRPDRLDFLVMVSLKTTARGIGIVDHPPGPVPFEPVELEPLFGGRYSSPSAGGTGDYVKSGRVVSPANWPAPRNGESDAS